MSVEADIAEMKSALAGLLADKGQSVADGLATLRATVEAMAARLNDIEVDADRAMKLHDDFPDDLTGGASGDWTGRISVAKTRWVIADWTNAPATDYLRIYYDATTPPEYTTSADYGGGWGDEYAVVRVRDLYAHHGDYIVPRG